MRLNQGRGIEEEVERAREMWKEMRVDTRRAIDGESSGKGRGNEIEIDEEMKRERW